MFGIRDALAADSACSSTAGRGRECGNAFLLLRPLLGEFGDRIINSPLAEGAVLGVCVGAALAGQRPIGELQFNDFVATGFNQLVNNAAMVRYRWGGSVPMVVRMPWGGLRYAGPYHSQNTEAWFYRTPGLKIVVPSTPHDARALFASAVADPDPVLYYEHIALYRDPRLRQVLMLPCQSRFCSAAGLRRAETTSRSCLRRYVLATRVADALAAGHRGERPRPAHARAARPGGTAGPARQCHKVPIVHEDSHRRGGQSLPRCQEEAFESLDAPVRWSAPSTRRCRMPPPLRSFTCRASADRARGPASRRVLRPSL
jgi:2-oxoisovalerate dehydrogenase E1 component